LVNKNVLRCLLKDGREVDAVTLVDRHTNPTDCSTSSTKLSVKSSGTNLIWQSNGFRVTSIAASQHHGIAFVARVKVDNKGVKVIAMDELSKQVGRTVHLLCNTIHAATYQQQQQQLQFSNKRTLKNQLT